MISQRLAAEFFNAVREYLHWQLSRRERDIGFDRYIQLSLVCGRVAPLTDPLPDEVFDAIYVLALNETHEHLKRELSADRTYATAARCLLELIEANKESLFMERRELD